MIFNSYPIEPAHLNDIGHNPLVYLLLRQISPGDNIAVVTEIFREYISPALQLGKGEVFSFIIRQQCLQRLFGIDILSGNLELPDGNGDLFSLNSRRSPLFRRLYLDIFRCFRNGQRALPVPPFILQHACIGLAWRIPQSFRQTSRSSRLYTDSLSSS